MESIRRILRNLGVGQSHNLSTPHELRDPGTAPLPRLSPTRRFVTIMTVDSLMVAPLPEVGDVIVGRGVHAQVRLADRAAGVRHARLSITDTAFFIEDLGTGGGTQVGGVALPPHTPTPVFPGEGIVIGETVLMVREVMREERPRSIWSHPAFAMRLEEECERACRSGAEFCLVRLRLTGATSGADGPALAAHAPPGTQKVAHPSIALVPRDRDVSAIASASVGDEVIAEPAVLAALALAAPAPHVVGLYGNQEYELLFVGDSAPRAQERLRALSAALADAGIEMRAGLAHFPSDGCEGEVLLAEATHRLFADAEGASFSEPPPAFDVADLPAGLRDAIEAAASHEGPICLMGERGVGKENIARAIHARSSRANGPFRVVELRGGVPADLEAELFGNRRSGRGSIADCRDGTLFLAGSESLSRGAALRLAFALRSKVSPGRPAACPRLIIATAGAPRSTRRGPARGQLGDIVGAERINVPPLRERRDELPDLIDRLVSEAARVRGVAAPV
ncbi:MAG TPA: sigma 54-interacting transcriptional regulator, partial [Polyangia bacterium]